MQVPRRFDSLEDYRYGFQGQEKDDEVKGEGNSLNYTFRMHDPRVGRFFAVDPLYREYPHYTPYSFSGNKVIAFKELEGKEEKIMIFYGSEWKSIDRSQFTTSDWLKIQTSVYSQIDQGFHGGTALFYGNKEYYSHQKIDDYHYVLTPKTGVLFMDTTGEYPVYEYRDTNENIRHGNETNQIFLDAIKKYNPIYSVETETSDHRDKAYAETMSNVRQTGFAIATMGSTININLGSKGLGFLKSSVGKGVFETVAQIAVKGDVKSVDISDVAATMLVNNKQASALLKSFVDISSNEGINIKDLNDGLVEFGLRIIIDKANPVDGKTGQKYVIDVVKKIELTKAKEALNVRN